MSSSSISSLEAARILATAQEDEQDDELKKARAGLLTQDATTDSTKTSSNYLDAAVTTKSTDDTSSYASVSDASKSDPAAQWQAFSATEAPTAVAADPNAETTTVEKLTVNNRYLRA